MKLHIGCGLRDFGKEWIHIDGANLPHVSGHDVMLEGLAPDSVDLIYCSHMLSYYDRTAAEILLWKWRQLLKPGGIIRLAVPDFEQLANAFINRGFKLKDILGPLYGCMKMNDDLIYHRTVYTYEDLEETFKNAGFDNIRRYDWRQTEHAHIDDQSMAHLPHDPEAIRTGNFTDKHILISLNVEATK